MDNNFIDPFPNIPEELKTCKQWVNYILTQRGNGKLGKPPTDQKGHLIDKTNTSLFVDYITACKAVGTNNVVGIGFVFTDSDNYVGVDLDGVVVEKDIGEGLKLYIVGEANKIVRVVNSYTELSVSGTGLHIICKGSFNQIKMKKDFLEIYQRNAYFTFSGKVLKEFPSEIKERSKQLQKTHDRYLITKEHEEEEPLSNMPTSSGSILDKVEPIQEHRERENKPFKPTKQLVNNIRPNNNKTDAQYLKEGLQRGKKLNELMDGNRTTKDESQNDYFLLQELAYWSNCNSDLMKRAFYYSEHYKTKDEPHKKKALSSYLERTIDKVIKSQRTTARIRDEQNKREYKKA